MPAMAFERPDVIIFSHPRSGTHLLQSCLESHPDVFARGECLLRYQRLAQASGPIPPEQAVYFRNHPGRMNVGIVMYSLADAFEELCGPLLDAKVIHLLREPSHVARSVAQMEADRRRHGPRHKNHCQVGRRPLRHAPIDAARVAALQERVKSQQQSAIDRLISHPRLLTISYEELTENHHIASLPRAASARLLSFLSLPFRDLTTTFQKTGV